MRSYLPDFVAHSAVSLPSALLQLAEPPHPELGAWQPLAGGTDLMVLLAAGKLPPGRYLDIFGLAELRGITMTPQHVELGALTTYTEVREHPLLQSEFPLLTQAAAESGAHAIQNRGTLGGNIANASPAADSPPALLAYGAELELRSASGSRFIDYADFHTGYKKTRMLPGELIVRVRLPRLAPALRDSGAAVHFYRKVGTRKAQAISKVCMAAFAVRDTTVPGAARLHSCRIALGSVAPIPLRCPRTEAALLAPGPLTLDRIAAAQQVLGREITPIDDIRSSASYRRRVAQNVLAQLVQTWFPALRAADVPGLWSLPLALFGCLVLSTTSVQAAEIGAKKADLAAATAADPPDLLNNRKILEATVAGFAKTPSGDAAEADGAAAPPNGKRGIHKLTLLELWDMAERRYPGIQAGRDSVRSARFTRDEQKWLRLPSGDFNAFLTWSPSVKCKDPSTLGYHTVGPNGPSALLGGDNQPVGASGIGNGLSSGACLETDASLNVAKDDFRNYLPLYGALVRIDLSVRQPLYTFGKLDAALKLGDVGVTLAQAAADGARADLAVNLVRAYFGVKAARAALDTIKDGRDQIVKWINQLDKELESGKTNFTEIDLMRLKVNESALQIQVSDATRLIASAIAALRFLAQDADADVDEEDLQLWAREDHDLAYYLDAALRFRPELRTLKATGEGALLYKKLRIAELFPDIGIGANLNYGYAGGIQDPANAFMTHFNYLGVGIGLGMRMSLDFGPKAARLQKSIAELHLFESRKREALGAGALDVERQYNDLHEAQQRLAAAEVGERRARGWLQGIKQNIDVGTAESRDMTEALRAYFEQHINVLRAINDVNVQAAVLRRLCGLEVIVK